MTDTTDQKLDRILASVVQTASDVRNIKDDLKAVRETVDHHTATLDGHTKMLIDLTTDEAALQFRLARYDKFMRIVADKLKLDLNKLLNI